MLQGIPLHPLSVHFGIVLGLLGAGAVLLAAVLPRFRRWLGWGLPAAALVAGAALRLTQSFGEILLESSPEYDTAAARQHGELGELAGTAGLVLAVSGVLLWLTTSPWARERWTGRWPTWVFRVAQVLSVLVPVTAIVLVTLAGHSGAVAVWRE